MKDPTKKEIIEYLNKNVLTSLEILEYSFSVEEAIYYIAYNYHSGQSSNLYSILSTSDYKPSMRFSGNLTKDFPEIYNGDSITPYLYEMIERYIK